MIYDNLSLESKVALLTMRIEKLEGYFSKLVSVLSEIDFTDLTYYEDANNEIAELDMILNKEDQE